MQELIVSAVFQPDGPGEDEDEVFDNAMDWLGSVVVDALGEGEVEGWASRSVFGGSEWHRVSLGVTFPDWPETDPERVADKRTDVAARIFHTLHPSFTVYEFEWGHFKPIEFLQELQNTTTEENR